MVEVNWGTEATNRYPINLIIEAYDRHGLVKDISNIITHENISIMGLTCNINRTDNIAYINLTIEIDSLALLSRISVKLKQLPNVLAVKRL